MMQKKLNVLVSTKETQGQRKNDFCFVPEGELMKFGFVCDRDRGRADGGCGCNRSLVGLMSLKATTTVKVVSMEMTKKQFEEKYIASEKKAWGTVGIDENGVYRNIDAILETANQFPENTVLEYRDEVFYARENPAEASGKA
jgi:hypothetical protein